MRIKAFLTSGRFKIIKAVKINDIERIARTYQRWEYLV
ncbi:hypothetical protein APAC_1988 [Malaciobacter pacificus]|jgi:hypothetical protein|uniref:Uncharacterized protein n=1 Tax=Malaciobacter pacificus TaxID=1080223 RepID=A0A5C2H7W6_9BACT|nr:hypothetical protein APAC_1988 [Malaciobacter pacificus]